MKIPIMLITLLSISSAQAAPPPEKIEVLIDVFEASEEPGSVDPGLAYLREQIKRFPFRFGRYRTLASATLSIAINQKELITFILPKELTLEVNPTSAENRLISFRIKLWEGNQLILTTEISLARGGTVIIGGPETDQGTILIAISEGW